MLKKILSLKNFKLLSQIERKTIIRPYLLTPWSSVLLEKLTGFQIVKKLPTFYVTRSIITAFTRSRHLHLS